MIKTYNKEFVISSKGMKSGCIEFFFKPSFNMLGKIIESVNEIRYSVTIGDDKIWILLPPSALLSFIAKGFQKDLLTHFQHRVTTNESGTSDWCEIVTWMP